MKHHYPKVIKEFFFPPRFFRTTKMSDTHKRKKGDSDSPLLSKTVSKMKLMEETEILKFQAELASDNPELMEGIKKLTESGLEYLTDFCQLHKVVIRGATISEIITNMLKDSLVNDHIQIRFGTDKDDKNYLWREIKAYKSAKLEEILETNIKLVMWQIL